jgi:hypothetical protein
LPSSLVLFSAHFYSALIGAVRMPISGKFQMQKSARQIVNFVSPIGAIKAMSANLDMSLGHHDNAHVLTT